MDNIDQLATALAAAQGEIMPAPKDADNPFFRSKYASLPAVREAMREAFARHGLSIVQIPEVSDDQLRLRTLLLHASGQSLDCGELSAEVDLANPQKIGSAISYFRRYALAAVSQTVADTDDDANAASQPTTASTSTPNAKEQEYITKARRDITCASSLDELATLGEELKAKPPHIQNALRDVYAAQKKTLKEQEHAES